MQLIELSDALIEALARLIDDSQAATKREPSHSTLSFHIERAGLKAADPASSAQALGKAKRLRAVLSWSLEHAPEAGGRLALILVGVLKASGGFRETSPNFVGAEALTDAIAAFRGEGYELSRDGELRPVLLDNLSDRELFQALQAYVRRAKRGATDAALVTGTGKGPRENK